jgi:lipid-binding SYLF domain-containing protein
VERACAASHAARRGVGARDSFPPTSDNHEENLMNRFSALLFTAALACGFAFTACSTAPRTAEGRTDLQKDAQAALAKAEARDPSLAKCLRDSYGYAVFPKVGKAAAGVGGGYGKGVLYQNGRMVGYCDLSQATVGLQLGGQTYTEIICFENEKALNEFKKGDLTFDAQASAVALKSGDGKNAKFKDGVAVFTMDEEGLMAEAAIGGQKFSYRDQ